MPIGEQLVAVAAWLRGRYEEAPAAELPLLAAVIAYLEQLAEHAAAPTADTARAHARTRDAEDVPSLGAVTVSLHGEEAPGRTAGAAELLGTFRETAFGGVVDSDAGPAIQVPYGTMQASGMRHGDRVRMTPKPGDPDRSWYERTGASVPLPPPAVREDVSVLRSEAGALAADVDGRRLRVQAASPRLPALAPGDVVTVRHSVLDPAAQPALGYVVRVHEDAAPSLTETAAALGGPKRRTVRRAGDAPREAPAVRAATPPDGLAEILVVGGHDRNRAHYRAALSGIAEVEWVSGARLTKSLRARVAGAAGVVLVIQHMPHTVSEFVLAEGRRRGTPLVMAQSENSTGLARQVQQELLPMIQKQRLIDAGPEADGGRAGLPALSS